MTDDVFRDVGYLDFSSGDFAFGADENDFSISLSASCPIPCDNAVIYSEDGTVGGFVRGSDSDDGDAKISGVTWTGLLAEHVIRPPTGQAYLTLQGDVTDIARQLVARMGLSALVIVDPALCGVSVRHTFAGARDSAQKDTGRFMNGWAALWQLVYTHGCKATFSWDPEIRKLVIKCSTLEHHEDSETAQALASRVHIKRRKVTNHLICLGKGEGAEREVMDLYANAAGDISKNQSMFGINEICEIYDNSSAEDSADLESSGRSKLRELIKEASEVSMQAPDGAIWDVGDIAGGTEPRTGQVVTATITKKVVKLDGENVETEYETSIRSK